MKGKCSEWVPVLSGTPEGGILSPLLFACFINDLPGSVEADALMFADDVKVYGRVDSDADVRFLQRQLDSLCQWTVKWGLSLNAAKCKVLTLTLRRLPINGTYRVGGIELERVHVMRDLGVLIDVKLTFAEHVDAVLRRANRALGLLVRTFQTGKHGRSFDESMTKPIIGTFCANVRSILEFCSVVWGGAAATHMNRVERIQHKFLMWLCARSRVNNVTLEYGDLLQCFGLCTLAARREQHDVMFIRNIHRQAIDSPFLLSQFPLAAPGRLLHNRSTFHVPRARVNTVKNGLFARIPELSNRFLGANCDVDVWRHGERQFKKRVVGYVRSK